MVTKTKITKQKNNKIKKWSSNIVKNINIERLNKREQLIKSQNEKRKISNEGGIDREGEKERTENNGRGGATNNLQGTSRYKPGRSRRVIGRTAIKECFFTDKENEAELAFKNQ